MLIHLADRVLHMLQISCFVLCATKTAECAFGADDVRQIILHRPAWASSRSLPFCFGQSFAKFLHRLPCLKETTKCQFIVEVVHGAGVCTVRHSRVRRYESKVSAMFAKSREVFGVLISYRPLISL